MRQEHDYLEEMGAGDRMVDTVSVDQAVNSTYSINQVLAGGFDARSNVQVRMRSVLEPQEFVIL